MAAEQKMETLVEKHTKAAMAATGLFLQSDRDAIDQAIDAAVSEALDQVEKAIESERQGWIVAMEDLKKSEDDDDKMIECRGVAHGCKLAIAEVICLRDFDQGVKP